MTYLRCADELMSQQEPDELPIQTDSPCPFCGKLVEWNGDQLYCEPCQRTWPDFAELTFDVWTAKAKARKAAHEATKAQRDESEHGYYEALLWDEATDAQRDDAHHLPLRRPRHGRRLAARHGRRQAGDVQRME